MTLSGAITFRVRLDDTRSNLPGHRWGVVLDDQGAEIGTASDYIYGGQGWCIQTAPYAGFAKNDAIELVD